MLMYPAWGLKEMKRICEASNVLFIADEGRPSSIAAAQEAVRTGSRIGLLLQDDSNIEQPGPEQLRRRCD
jgi:hypothetical protein